MVRRRKWTYIHTHRGASVSPWILPRANKQSTGLFVAPVCALVPPFRIQFHPLPIIKATRLGGFYYWQRMRDSNPRKRSQSPVCYRYTNPLTELLSEAHDYYSDLFRKVKTIFSFFAEIKTKRKSRLRISPEKQDISAVKRACFRPAR